MSGAMRRVLLLRVMAGSASVAVMSRQANKTYFAPRNELQQAGRLWAVESPYSAKAPEGVATQASVAVFASKSTNDVGIGRYLGGSLKDDSSDANGTVTVDLSSAGLLNGLFDRQIDHTYSTAGDGASMYGQMKLRPEQKRLGAVVSLESDLGKLLGFDGLRFSFAMPFVRITNNLGVTYPSSTASHTGTNKVVTAASTIKNFFEGNYTQPGTNSQEELKFGKVTTADQVRSGIADVKAALMYDVVRLDEGLVQLRGGLILPLGTKPEAEYLFTPTVGNGSHVGFMCGARGEMLLWKNEAKHMSLILTADAEFTFLLASREKRIPGIYNTGASVQALVPWGHTALGVQYQNPGLFPLANVLARDMMVIPGPHFELTTGLTYTWKDFYAKCAYNAFYRKTEVVDLADQWPTDRYGMATYDYHSDVAATNFTAAALTTTSKHAVGPLAVRNSTATHLTGASVVYQVDTAVCTAPDVDTQQVLIGGGYKRVIKGMPVDLGAFASYEFALDTSKAVNGWAVGFQLGVSF